jgi:hypothetical protein
MFISVEVHAITVGRSIVRRIASNLKSISHRREVAVAKSTTMDTIDPLRSRDERN